MTTKALATEALAIFYQTHPGQNVDAVWLSQFFNRIDTKRSHALLIDLSLRLAEVQS